MVTCSVFISVLISSSVVKAGTSDLLIASTSLGQAPLSLVLLCECTQILVLTSVYLVSWVEELYLSFHELVVSGHPAPFSSAPVASYDPTWPLSHSNTSVGAAVLKFLPHLGSDQNHQTEGLKLALACSDDHVLVPEAPKGLSSKEPTPTSSSISADFLSEPCRFGLHRYLSSYNRSSEAV